MAEYITNGQSNYGWSLTWDAAGRYPIIAKRRFATLADAQAFVDDVSATATATEGLIISVIKDDVVKNNGVYYVQSVAMAEGEKGTLIKVGGTETETAENYSAAIALSQTLVVGQLIKVLNTETTGEGEGALTYQAGFYIVESPGTISALATSTGSDNEVGALKARVDVIESDYVTETELTEAINGIELPEVPVKDVKYGENTLLDENGIADLSDFAKTSDLNAYVTKEGYIPYTEDEKTKLAGIAEGAEVNFVKSVGENLSVDGEGNLTVDMSSKVDVDGYVAYSTEEKNKLAGIAEGAEVNFVKSVGDNLDVDENGKLTVTIPEVEVPFQSVAEGDKVLTLTEGVLSSTLSYARAEVDGVDSLVLKGVNDEIIGSVPVAEFVADGMLDSVTPVEGTNEFLFTFKTGNGTTKEFKVDFSKYVDTYHADGETIELGADNTFKVKENVFDSYGAASTVSSALEAYKTENNALVESKANAADVYSITDADAKFVEKIEGKSLSTNDFTDDLKTKLENIANIKTVGDNLSVDDEGKLNVDLASFATTEKLNEGLSDKLNAIAKVNNKQFSNDEVTIHAGDISLESIIARNENEIVYEANTSIQAVLASLSSRIDALDPNISGEFGVSSITAGSGIEVTGASSTPTISLKISETPGNMAELKTDGIYVNGIPVEGDDIEK